MSKFSLYTKFKIRGLLPFFLVVIACSILACSRKPSDIQGQWQIYERLNYIDTPDTSFIEHDTSWRKFYLIEPDSIYLIDYPYKILQVAAYRADLDSIYFGSNLDSVPLHYKLEKNQFSFYPTKNKYRSKNVFNLKRVQMDNEIIQELKKHRVNAYSIIGNWDVRHLSGSDHAYKSLGINTFTKLKIISRNSVYLEDQQFDIDISNRGFQINDMIFEVASVSEGRLELKINYADTDFESWYITLTKEYSHE